MSERDCVDWIVIGASILSSLGIIVTIGVYLSQKKNNKTEKIKNLKIRLKHHSDVNLNIVSDLLELSKEIKRRKDEVNITATNFMDFILVYLENQSIKYIKGVNPKAYGIYKINPEKLEESLILCSEHLPSDVIELFQKHIICSYNMLFDSILLGHRLIEKKPIESLSDTLDSVITSCNQFTQSLEKLEVEINSL
ncbi:TPA: hypothetical protein ACS727_003805 [Providencia alcalifaciens]|uniref:DUF4760 domain-containing protein n=1 Tax=Providencia alcalifaciens 205/92 TaxID=1256988 RepID=A0AAV3M0U4_9GAMM|nr:hypothetical protein [Providencia alcalifaciens]EUD09229.1 hypothetical protein HMPREF1563_3360 [Providencia alcalifaciens 205/92]MTC63222.1 hypothetical protein [Providencia alcalifaciens]WGZ52664.1 hypothetical protein PO864_10255 [Providencia alcalifaciens]